MFYFERMFRQNVVDDYPLVLDVDVLRAHGLYSLAFTAGYTV